ncbi:MAG: formate dehydrogenase subunit gamma [Desulfobacterales bacterium]
MKADRIRRFSPLDRLFHLTLMLTFLIQSATGFSRLFITTGWGRKLSGVFGGYEGALVVHRWVGVFMLLGFAVHIGVLISRIRWKDPKGSIFGPDSLVPNENDFRRFAQQVAWFFGRREAPRHDRWTYWEKFDYWAVFWGMPLLGATGLMLMFPMISSRYFEGWVLNVAALLHRAEAILAVSYIFIVHFFIGHLRPSSFPMNEAMFSGSVPVAHAAEEKPEWVARLKAEGRLEDAAAAAPASWYRVAYFVFGYTALCVGIYLLINAVAYSRFVQLH